MEKVFSKVQKLLAKTVNNPSVAEAQSAFLLAQKILAENGLTMDQATSVPGDSDEGVIDIRSKHPGRPYGWKRVLALIIGKNFRCQSYYRGNYIGFIGLKSDVELAVAVFDCAFVAIKRLSKDYLESRKSTEHVPPYMFYPIKNDYILGFNTGLKEKFERQVDQNGWGLILVKSPAVDEFVRNIGHDIARRPKITVAGDRAARKQGREDGKSFGIGESLNEGASEDAGL